MACVTLKRPLEWVDPSMSANSEPSGSNSPTSMVISNSPPHPGARSPKRLCLQGFTSPSSSSGYPQYYHSNNYHHQAASSLSSNNFNSIKLVSSSEIVNQIRDEVCRLRLIRRPKYHLKSTETSQISSQASGNKSPSPSESSMNSSPSSSPKHDFIQAEDPFQAFVKRQKTLSLADANLPLKESSVSNTKAAIKCNNKLNDTPLFTYNQVLMIVERLFREKEDEIRRQYDELLDKRLSDQYDQFVKFNTDQMKRYDRNNLPSYLS